MDQLKSLLRRPKFYNNIDGVGELGIGFALLSFALVGWLLSRGPENSLGYHLHWFQLWCLLMLLAIPYGSKAIKKRITYPRTGFVAYRKRFPFWVALIYGIGAGTLLRVGGEFFERSHGEITRPHWGITTPAALGGLLFAACYAYGYARTVRWKRAVAGVLAIGTVAIAMLSADALGVLARDSWGHSEFLYRCGVVWFLFLMLYGTVLLISGGVSFALYLLHTQPAAETAE